MIIAILGAGNIGTLMAGEFAAKGHEVRVFSSHIDNTSGAIDVLDSLDNVLMTGKVKLVTTDLGAAIDSADYIWITYPTFMMKETADSLLGLIEREQTIDVVPGNDAEFFFNEHVKRGVVLFGLQRVHSIARLKERGRSVYMLGRKSELQVAALPSSETKRVSREVEALFDIPTVPLPHYLVETLTPSNPILHTTRIHSMFRHWMTPTIETFSFMRSGRMLTQS